MNQGIETMLRVLREEAESILFLGEKLGEPYQIALDLIVNCKGRVITCGVGKSGHIARKTAGTLSSTGTPSAFMHAAEALHGDLGMVTSTDVVLAYSHSGETDEIVRIFPSLKIIGAKTILMTGRTDSSAANLADVVINTWVQKEACNINLAPTNSTTVMLALSDAFAVAAMEIRDFNKEQFAVFHPSGALGKRLLLTVQDVMRQGEDNPIVSEGTTILDVLAKITRATAGAACVIDEQGKMIGLITDGDIRRYLLAHGSVLEGTASHAMSRQFSSLSADLLAVDALEFFQNHPKKIGEVPVLNTMGNPIGLLMLKDVLRSGIV